MLVNILRKLCYPLEGSKLQCTVESSLASHSSMDFSTSAVRRSATRQKMVPWERVSKGDFQKHCVKMQ